MRKQKPNFYKDAFHFIVITLIVILAINVVSASVSQLDPIRQGECINLPQTSPSATFVNITQITYQPTSTQLLNESLEMNVNGTYRWNYLYCNATELGNYVVDGISDDTDDQTFTYTFTVTPSGTFFTNALSIPLFLPIGLMLGLSIFFFIIIGFVEKKEYKFTFLIFSGLFIIFAISYGIIASREVLYGFPLLYNFVNSFYRIFIITTRISAIIIPIIVMFFVIKRAFDKRGYNITK